MTEDRPDGYISEPVDKRRGYPFPGEIRSLFRTAGGEIRVVVEMHVDGKPCGLLHIFNMDQLKRRKPNA